ncbi:hypothetical protein KFK09_010826 [Dendrobium nobile]|uniref:Retrotransposon gag domain-containing protein n=1 Tax=Dendrobium nobile TaxID=94219 RepID=A0A8T3BE50_DENNO|nr:hypothetical protein KFK09_010826 [Dendrobium nobile]
MAGKKVEALEGEFGQLKTDLEGKFMEISTNNERLEGRFAAMEEMMKKLLEMKTHPDTSEVRETTDGHGVGGNPNPVRGRRNPEVEILEGDDDMPPLEPFSREEISMGNDRRGADFQRRGADFQRRGAEFQRRGVDFGSRRGEYEGSADFGERREEHQRRGAEFQRRGADFERGRGDYDEDFGYQRRREDRDTWGAPHLRGTGGYGDFRGNGRDPKVRKLKMPIFEGEDGHGWIYKVERYFAVNGLTDDEKLTAAGLCLEGKALAWYQWRDRREPIRTWREFKDCLLERFRADGGGDFYEQFFALTQEGTVADYRDRFEYLASRLDHISESALEGNFMKGLKPEIRTAVRVLEPRNLGKAMELAQLVEDQKKSERGARGNNSGGSNRTTTTLPAPKGPTSGNSNETTREKPVGGSGENFKRLTEEEVQDKRTKGLCFRCDEKYMPGHRCKDRTLHVLLVCEDEEDEEGGGSRSDDEEEKLHLDVAEVSLNSVVGFTPNHTMKVRGEIADREVVVLIDSGATHNFISNQIVESLGMELVDTGGYGVMMGTGKVEMGRGVCRGVVLKIQGIHVKEDFLSLELGSTDVILGMKWLQTLGETKDNWGALTMELMVDGRKMVIRGDAGLSKATKSLKTMVRDIQEVGEDYLVGLHKLDLIRMEEEGDVSLSMQPLVQQYSEDFQSPQGWPPPREHEYISTLRTRWIFGRGVLLDRSTGPQFAAVFSLVWLGILENSSTSYQHIMLIRFILGYCRFDHAICYCETITMVLKLVRAMHLSCMYFSMDGVFFLTYCGFTKQNTYLHLKFLSRWYKDMADVV